MSTKVLFQKARKNYHAALIKQGVLALSPRKKPKREESDHIPSNADGGSATSIAIARAILDRIQSKTKATARLVDQVSGNLFEQLTQDFIAVAFSALQDTRPGIDDNIAGRTDLRRANNHLPLPLLHGSISCIWALSGDCAQNTRSEALPSIRNRKRSMPHIAVVTGEPLPSRLASLALGTSGIDCVYHFALPELIASIRKLKDEEALNLVGMLVGRGRLKDISDLPLDLAV